MKDEFITVLGCSSQHQFCNPNLPAESGCTPLSGLDYGLDHAVTSSDIWKTDKQRASVGYISRRYLLGDITSTIKDLGAFSLLSRRNIEGTYSAKLPEDQWQQDVQYWFNTSLVILQRQIFEQATGPNSEYIAEHSIRPKTDAEWARCRNQVRALSLAKRQCLKNMGSFAKPFHTRPVFTTYQLTLILWWNRKSEVRTSPLSASSASH